MVSTELLERLFPTQDGQGLIPDISNFLTVQKQQKLRKRAWNRPFYNIKCFNNLKSILTFRSNAHFRLPEWRRMPLVNWFTLGTNSLFLTCTWLGSYTWRIRSRRHEPIVYWNKALGLAVASHMKNFSQSEWIILE